jgi:hypothetical protein
MTTVKIIKRINIFFQIKLSWVRGDANGALGFPVQDGFLL